MITPERNAWAWKRCFAALREALAAAEPTATLYVLIGPQASGKSTWARSFKRQQPQAVIFDAILVKRSERAPVLAEARLHDTKAVAVWFHTPLAVCLARNAARPPDEVAHEQGLRNVFAAVEPPTEEEGFAAVVHVAHTAA